MTSALAACVKTFPMAAAVGLAAILKATLGLWPHSLRDNEQQLRGMTLCRQYVFLLERTGFLSYLIVESLSLGPLFVFETLLFGLLLLVDFKVIPRRIVTHCSNNE